MSGCTKPYSAIHVCNTDTNKESDQHADDISAPLFKNKIKHKFELRKWNAHVLNKNIVFYGKNTSDIHKKKT